MYCQQLLQQSLYLSVWGIDGIVGSMLHVQATACCLLRAVEDSSRHQQLSQSQSHPLIEPYNLSRLPSIHLKILSAPLLGYVKGVLGTQEHARKETTTSRLHLSRSQLHDISAIKLLG